MIRALFSAGSGMVAQQMNVDNIAHNLANSKAFEIRLRRLAQAEMGRGSS